MRNKWESICPNRIFTSYFIRGIKQIDLSLNPFPYKILKVNFPNNFISVVHFKKFYYFLYNRTVLIVFNDFKSHTINIVFPLLLSTKKQHKVNDHLKQSTLIRSL